MTAQIHDTVAMAGESFSLVAVDGGPLPSPMDFAMFPRPLHTACWRGFHCTYLVDDDGYLALDSMTVGRCDDGWVPVNGTEPVGDESEKRYEGIGLRIRFNGRLQVASGFIGSMYDHMGFHPSECFEVLLELEFSDGRLVRMTDLSEENAELRESGREGEVGRNLAAWIARRFSLDPSLKGVELRRPGARNPGDDAGVEEP